MKTTDMRYNSTKEHLIALASLERLRASINSGLVSLDSMIVFDDGRRAKSLVDYLVLYGIPRTSSGFVEMGAPLTVTLADVDELDRSDPYRGVGLRITTLGLAIRNTYYTDLVCALMDRGVFDVLDDCICTKYGTISPSPSSSAQTWNALYCAKWSAR